MLIKKLPHILLTLLVAILIGCGTSNPLADEAKSSYEGQNYEEALTAAEQSIEEYPGDPSGYFYKAAALGGIAESKDDPAERQEYYKQMNETFDMAQSIADTSENVPDEIERIPSVKVAFWQSEFKQGYDLATDDSLQGTVENPMEKSVQHLRNATALQPDSASTWDVLAQITARNENFEEAASAKEKYMNMIPETDVDTLDYLQLGNYYFNLDQHEKVVETLEKGKEQYPGSRQIVSSLTDAYNRIGKSEKALETLEQLVEQEPENPRYRLVMGTNIYQQALQIQDTVATNSQEIAELQNKFQQANPSEREEIKSKIQEISDENEELLDRMQKLTKRAEEEIKTALEYEPNNPDAYETLGVIYQNRAKSYFDQRNRATDNAEADKYDKMGKDTIREAKDYFEKAVEINPDNQNYWRSLFQIYTFLGMDEKAQEAMEKADM